MNYKLIIVGEDKGDYTFSGKALISRGVSLVLSQVEIDSIIYQVQEHCTTQSRDYVLVFENEEGQRVLAIDNISESDKEELKANGYTDQEIATHTYYTLVFSAMEV